MDLQAAASEGNVDAVKKLLGYGADLSIKEGEYRSALQTAAWRGYQDIMKILLDYGADVSIKEGEYGNALQTAAWRGHQNIVKILLDYGADVNTTSKKYGNAGRTPLSLATDQGYETVVKLLLATDGVDLNSKDSNGQTSLSLAAERGHVTMVKLLLAKGGVDLNSKDNNGQTPLSLAAKQGNVGVVVLLLATDGVDLNSKDSNGKTPLSLAADQGHETVVKPLLATDGVDLNSKDNNGQTPLSLAAQFGHGWVVKLLLATDGIDLNSKDNNGKTPLSLAAMSGCDVVAELLLAKDDVDLNSKDNNGQAPLSLAAQFGHGWVVMLLLAKDGVDLNSKDNNGQTPLSLATQFRHRRVEMLLLAKDGVPARQTPAKYADQLEYSRIVERVHGDQPRSTSEERATESVQISPKPLDSSDALINPMSSSGSRPERDIDLDYPAYGNSSNSLELQMRRPTTTVKHLPNEMEHDKRLLPFIEDASHLSDALALPISTQTRRRMVFFFGAVIQSCKLPIKMLRYLWQPSVPSGYVQVSWTCRCGKRLRADFRETDRVAAIEFATEAAGPSNSCTVSSSGSEGETSTMSSSKSGSSTSRTSSPGYIPETPSSITPSVDDEPHDPIIPPGTKRYLLLCVNSGIYCINLIHVDVTRTGNDEVLFQQIRTAYSKLRGNKAKNVFVVAKTMQYIQFELIRRHKSGECVGNFEKDSIPSKKEVLKAEYSFKPCPPTIGKLPMPPHIFMHSFQEPGDHTGSLAVERLPKKLREKLSCHNNQLNVPVGWGIYIIEGYNWKLIRRCAGSAFLATFILTVLWCILKKDVQGGTGIGQYSTAALALALAMFVSEQVYEG